MARGVSVGGPSDDVDEFREAVEAFRARVPLTDEEFESILAIERDYAFHVAGAVQADVVKEVFEALERAVAEGTDFEDFKEAAAEGLYESWGGEDPARLETVFITNVNGAYAEGREEMLRDPDVLEARPYWRFDGVDDARQSEICAACDGVVLPASHPWWETHTPLMHHRCRSRKTPLSEEEALAAGVTESPPGVHAAEGFGRGTVARYRARSSDYPPEIRGEARQRIGED